MHWQELQDGEDLNPQDYVNEEDDEEDNAHDHVQDADDAADVEHDTGHAWSKVLVMIACWWLHPERLGSCAHTM